MESVIVCYEGNTMVLKDVLTGDYQISPSIALSAVNASEAPYVDTGTNISVSEPQRAGISLSSSLKST